MVQASDSSLPKDLHAMILPLMVNVLWFYNIVPFAQLFFGNVWSMAVSRQPDSLSLTYKADNLMPLFNLEYSFR